MAWVAPVIAAGSAVFNAIEQHRANKERINETDTAIQRRMADLKAAGVNPALAYTQLGGAQTPDIQPVQFDTNVAGDVQNAYNQSFQQSLIGLQKQQAEAQIRLTNAQTAANAEQALKTKEERLSVVPATAENIASQSQELDSRAQVLAKQFQQTIASTELTEAQTREKNLTNAQLEQIQPVLLEYQKYITEAEKLGLSEAKADSQFFEQLPSGKWSNMIKDMIMMWKTHKESR